MCSVVPVVMFIVKFLLSLMAISTAIMAVAMVYVEAKKKRERR